MNSLRNILQSITTKSDGVIQLLQCLPQEHFSMDVHLCSFGGVGTSEVSNFLNLHGISTNLLSDEDNLKHINSPPKHGSPGPKCVIYLYGDPLASIASHYRRGHAYHQALKTSGKWLKENEFPKTFREYVERGEDLFGYYSHFQHWLSSKTDYNIVMVRYEFMWEQDIFRQLLFLACGHIKGKDEIEQMTQSFCLGWRGRQSLVPPDCRQGLYNDLLSIMDNLPPLFVRDQEGSMTLNFGVLSHA
ncbi:hypothetical protein CEUSTIGMA_g7996.t1 [Chlamydomonas eustigma]|uniref:Sulfotransferase n=1 Tax=Chlamydomonas eustigma TaxID=1157962 RepID=A0A250XCE8_9CHLO|nr:hypothetical protein CEUSTIGMA_g7996.t1 [Chlamydomonas eustigma]|eukprot:GAX80559.1 hypothetical protein CEUSTIGMA_g7996.t1 [Chlamydomonas eustigma]